MCGRFDVSKGHMLVFSVLQPCYCVCCNHVYVIKEVRESVWPLVKNNTQIMLIVAMWMMDFNTRFESTLLLVSYMWYT